MSVVLGAVRGTNDAGDLGWRDITSSPTVRGVGANDPSWSVFQGGIRAYEFSPTSMKEVWFNFHIDHDYAPGTKIYLHCHWSTTGTNTGNVRWGFEYSYAKGHQQDEFPATTTVYVEQAGAGVAYCHMVAEISDGDALLSGVEPDGIIMVRVFRDAAHANDTNTDSAFLITADCHYQTDRIATPQKAPDFYAK